MGVAEGVAVGGKVGIGGGVSVLAINGRGVSEDSPRITMGRDNTAGVEVGVSVGVKDGAAIAGGRRVLDGNAELVGMPRLGKLHPFRVNTDKRDMNTRLIQR